MRGGHVHVSHFRRSQGHRTWKDRCRRQWRIPQPYYGLKPGKGEIPGLWLVGDQGVYIMSNGKLTDGDRPLVVYSDECHPVGNPDWFHYKHRHFGDDDGIEFIDAERLIPLFDRNFRCTHLHVQLTEVSLSLIAR